MKQPKALTRAQKILLEEVKAAKGEYTCVADYLPAIALQRHKLVVATPVSGIGSRRIRLKAVVSE